MDAEARTDRGGMLSGLGLAAVLLLALGIGRLEQVARRLGLAKRRS